MNTETLNLILTLPEEYSTKKVSEFIAELAGSEETSSLQVIDKAIGELRDELSALENQLSSI